METNHQDMWVILKDSWVPRPAWLSDGIVCLATPGVHSLERPADASGGRPEARISAHEADEAGAPKHERLCDASDRRRKKEVSRAAGMPAANRKVHSSAISGRSGRGSRMGNVVELWPHARNYAAADCILRALCAALEAQAAGQDEIMMVRIRQLYHLFEDVAG